jgi:putative membrane protein
MGKILAIGVLLMMGMIGCSKKSSNSVTSLNSTDQQFVTNAGYNNVDEIDAGYLASTNAPDTNVRAFGLLMVNDYGGAQSSLVLLADSLGFTVLSSPDPAHVRALSALQMLSGVAFDTTYLRLQINDDQAAITLYQAEQSNGQNAAVKAYASEYLPMIQAHLTAADSLILVWAGH